MVSSKGPSVFLLLGEEDFLKQQQLDFLKNKFFEVNKASQVDFHIFNSRQTDLSGIIDTASTYSFLAGRRLIAIKGIDRYDPEQKETLLKFLKNPSRENIFILESAHKALPKDGFYQQLSKIARVFIFNRLYDRNLSHWISKQFEFRKKSIHPQAVELLVRLKGNNLANLYSEVDKLVCYSGSSGNITAQHVIDIVGKDTMASVYDLMDALSQRAADKALLLSFDFDSKRIPEAAGLLTWQMRRLLRAKSLLAKGWNAVQLQNELGIRKFFMGRFMSQVNALDMAWMKKAISELMRFDLSLKTGRAADPEQSWQILIVKLSASL